MAIPYQQDIQDAASQYGVPPAVLAGVIAHESGFNPSAINHDSNGTVDRGIAQLNSAYYPASLANNPVQAIYKAANILSQHHSQCGSWSGAIAAYNLGHCGPNPSYVSAVEAQIQKYASLGGGNATGSSGGGTAGPAGAGSGSFWSWLHDNTGWLVIPGFLLIIWGLWEWMKEPATTIVKAGIEK